MTYLTNKTVEAFKDVKCSITGISFRDINSISIPEQLVLDIAPNNPTRGLQYILNTFRCRYIESSIEFKSGNIIYIIQDGLDNIIKITIL